MLFGGSWGSSLALAYAEQYPKRCIGLVLRGIFLCRHNEVDWFLNGMCRFFPEAWREFVEYLPTDERSELLGNYYRRLIDPDPDVHMPAARSWSRYEGSCSTLLPSAETVAALSEPKAALGLSRIEAHYFANNLFLEEGALLACAGKLAAIPGVIVQGRYDMVCPIASAAELADAWPTADFQIVPDAGHSAMEPGIRKALVQATERMKGLV
jgi:proline iminopeptidase